MSIINSQLITYIYILLKYFSTTSVLTTILGILKQPTNYRVRPMLLNIYSLYKKRQVLYVGQVNFVVSLILIKF